MLELTYVDKGSIHSVAGGQDLVLEQGDMAIYGPNQWHMQYADRDCAPSYITITFDLEGDSLERLLNRKFRTPQKAVLLLQQMLRERDQEDVYTGDMLISLLGQLLLTVLREAEGPAHAPLRTANAIHSENEVVGHAQRFIGQNVRQKLSVPMVAREVGVSPSYLTALFHKNLQISPGEYIRRAKLQESKLMIAREDDFTEIAQVLQYSWCTTSPGSSRKNLGSPPRIRPVYPMKEPIPPSFQAKPAWKTDFQIRQARQGRLTHQKQDPGFQREARVLLFV